MKKILIVAVILLASCAPSKKYVWSKQGATEEGLFKDRHSCRILADDYRAYFSKPKSQPINDSQGIKDFDTSRSDLTYEAKAKQLFEECMGAKGYELVEQKP